MRSSAIEELAQDYIRTARAKGLQQRLVMTRHLLRNALLPIVTILGLSLPDIVAGAVIAEAIFNFPGMGLLFLAVGVEPRLPGPAWRRPLIIGVANCRSATWLRTSPSHGIA